MKADVFQKKDKKVEAFIDNRRRVPLYRKYGLALSVASLHAAPGDVCIVNLHKLLHACALLDSLYGATTVVGAARKSSVVATMAELDVDYLRELGDNERYHSAPNITTRYDEVLDLFVRATLKYTDVNRRNSPAKGRFVRSLGKNNCAILFNSDPTIGKLLPRKFEIFKAVVNTMAQSPEIPGTEYEKILNVSAWTIPNYHLMNYNAVLLKHTSISAANASHAYCYLFCETYQEYYTIMPSLPLCNMLNTVVTSPVNEPALRKGPLQYSLNTVINGVYATNSSDVSEAYLKVARNKEFRRIY